MHDCCRSLAGGSLPNIPKWEDIMTILHWGRVTLGNRGISNINDPTGSVNLLKDYLGMEYKHLLVLIVLIVIAFCGAATAYITTNGFRAWRRNIMRAKSSMVINFTTNPSSRPPIIADKFPTDTLIIPTAVSTVLLYRCPICGVVGKLKSNSNGNPTCPSCGATMTQLLHNP